MPKNLPEGTTPTATFIFEGTVKKVKSATMKNIDVNKQTLVVTCDQVIEAPKSMAKLGGTELTVQLTGHQKAQVGQSMIFHTTGWIFGDSVAVQCVKQEPIRRTHAALLRRGGNPVEHRRDHVVQNRFADSDIVCSGTVAMVKLPEEPAAIRRTARAVTVPVVTGPISEHNPHWRDAVIEIDETQKGGSQNRMVIRFPASRDVRWYKAPKFTPGQKGYFMLHKTKVTEKKKAKKPTKAGGPTMALAAAAELKTEEVYTCLHPADFQPYSQPGGIKRIVGPGNDEPEG